MLATQTPTSRSPRPLLGLDDLALKTSDELDALYRAAKVSMSMRAADGAIATPLRRWAASPSFMWEGKTFQADSDTRGMGHNRVNVPGVFGRQNLFPFETSFGPSAIDGKPTLILDYDLGVNPGYIRKIHDEIREVAPGIFLGPAMWKGATGKALVLWFGLDATRVAERPS